MTLEEMGEVICAVEGFNEKLEEAQMEEFGWNPISFEVHTNGTEVAVEFLGTTIWSSTDDVRDDDDDTGEPEPIVPYLQKEANALLNLARRIKKI